MIGRSRKKIFLFLVLVFFMAAAGEVQGKKEKAKPKNSLLGQSFHAVVPTMRPEKILDSSGAIGAPGFHRHLVRPGAITTYMIRLYNPFKSALTVELKSGTDAPGWETSLASGAVEMLPAESKYVLLSVKPASSLPAGRIASVKVRAASSAGSSEEITLEAETTEKHKIYIISLDSLGLDYLALNHSGSGSGKDNDWLMPNLHEFLRSAVFYPRHQCHLPAATDMNHSSYLTGAYPGRLGLYSVQVFMFGFDEKGWAIWRSTPHDLMYWGPEGKPVSTIFNVVKDPGYGGNSSAFTAFVSGKDWVPEHFRNPVYGLDRIVTVTDYPDYVTPSAHVMKPSESIRFMLESRLHKLNRPDFALWEDVHTVDQAIEVIDNEDPDVCYVLLGGVDEAGHYFGSGKNPSEWDERGSPEKMKDDTSRINKSGNREGILKTVRAADEQLGRLLKRLQARRGYEDAYIVIESDHDMETNSFIGPALHKVLPQSGYSKKKDYYAFTGSQLGEIFLRREDPQIAIDLERTLEAYRWKSPITGESECPVIVLNRQEMKTGIDQATGRRVTPPMELYSEYYIEHPQSRGMRYPDLFMFPKANLQFPSIGAGFGNIGLGVLPLDVPPFTVYVGGHGAPSTRKALLAIKGPGQLRSESVDAETYPSDLAPTLYRLEHYQVPASVQGKGLPNLDPSLP